MMLVRRAALLLLTGAVLGGTIRWWRTARNLPDGRDELRIAYSDNISGLDPRNLRSPPSLTQRMTDAVWDELIAFDPQTLKPVPRIAEDWQVLDQGRRYLIRLGQGHRWSNGDPVTAGDFVRTVRWLLAKDADHPLLRLLGEAGRSPAAGQDGRDEISVSAPDRFTLEIRLREAPPDFVPMLAALCWIPLHESSVEAFERGDWSEPDRLVSNGPFRLRYFGPAEVLLDRNPHHGERTGFARVRLLRTESPLLYPMLLRAGRVDFADALNFLPRNFPPRVPGVTMEHENTASVSTLQFNATRPPLQDPRVRRALSLALDRAALAARLGGGGALPAYSFTPPGQFGNKPEHTVGDSPCCGCRSSAART
jgi:ABC-type oligopeptide transport system substrate-binding subunit